MEFPIILIKDKEAPIYFFRDKQFGLISKNGESFYSSGYIYDSSGMMYRVTSAIDIRKAPILKSLKFLQQMYEVTVVTDFMEKVDLQEFKNIICRHIESHSKYWSKRDVISKIVSHVNSLKSYSDIIYFVE